MRYRTHLVAYFTSKHQPAPTIQAIKMNFSQIIASLLLTIAAAEEATGVLRRDLLTCDNVRHLRGNERELRCSGCLVADCAAGEIARSAPRRDALSPPG